MSRPHSGSQQPVNNRCRACGVVNMHSHGPQAQCIQAHRPASPSPQVGNPFQEAKKLKHSARTRTPGIPGQKVPAHSLSAALPACPSLILSLLSFSHKLFPIVPFSQGLLPMHPSLTVCSPWPFSHPMLALMGIVPNGSTQSTSNYDPMHNAQDKKKCQPKRRRLQFINKQHY